MCWNITPFLFKENILIFPEPDTTARSISDLLQKEKQKINMFVSENTRNSYLEKREKSEIMARRN